MPEDIITATGNENQIPTIQADASPKEIAHYAVSVLDMKKARDIKLLHTEKQTIIADYFVICSGTSRTQIKSLADEVAYKLSLCGIHALRTEGEGDCGWVLIDFGSVIVHIFSREQRQFYELEKLYPETSEEDVSALLHEN